MATRPPSAVHFETMRRPLPAGEALASRYDVLRGRPGDRPGDAFALLVPKGFAADRALERKAGAGPSDWVPLGALRAEDGDSIELFVAPLGRDVSLADLVAWELERRGLEPISVEPLDYGGREAVDATARVPLTEEQFLDPKKFPPKLERLVLVRRGDGVVRLSLTAVRDRWHERASDAAWAVSSLRFDEPREATFLEPYVWVASAGAIPLGFRAPASWRAEERQDPPWGREVIDVRRIDRGAPVEFMRAIAVDRDTNNDLTTAALAAETFEHLRREGLQPGPLRRRTAPPSPGEPFRAATIATVHEGRAFGGPCEARVHVLETARALYALAAIVPARDHDRVGWMCGKRVLEIAYQTLLRPEEAILTPEGTRRAALAAAAARAAPDPVAPVVRPVVKEEE